MSTILSRRRWRTAVVLAVLAALPLALAWADVAVQYKNGSTAPGTSYTNNVLGSKTYNEMSAGTGNPVGIYELRSDGTGRTDFDVDGLAFVSSSHAASTRRAFCWNRSGSTSFSATCTYHHP